MLIVIYVMIYELWFCDVHKPSLVTGCIHLIHGESMFVWVALVYV